MKPNFSIPLAIGRHVSILPAVVLAFISWLSPCAKAAELEEKAAAAIQHYNLGKDKVALSGYDPVGYFTRNKALKGRKENNHDQRHCHS